MEPVGFLQGSPVRLTRLEKGQVYVPLLLGSTGERFFRARSRSFVWLPGCELKRTCLDAQQECEDSCELAREPHGRHERNPSSSFVASHYTWVIPAKTPRSARLRLPVKLWGRAPRSSLFVTRVTHDGFLALFFTLAAL